MSVLVTTIFASEDFGPDLFKPKISVALCCQGDQTTTASHLWQSCSHSPAEVIRFMGHSFHSSPFNKMWDGLDLFWFVGKSHDYWWHQHCSVRAVLFFLRCLPPANFAQKCRFGCIRWMYFLGGFFLSVFCIVYMTPCVVFLCKCIRVFDECSTCQITTSDWQKPKPTLKRKRIYI